MKHSHGLDSLRGRSEAESFHVNYKTKGDYCNMRVNGISSAG